MGINWRVRVKNKLFWLAIIPAVLLLIQQVAGLFGLAVDFTQLQDKIIDIVGSVFCILAILGIVADPTTKGMTDSAQAMTYNEPKGES